MKCCFDIHHACSTLMCGPYRNIYRLSFVFQIPIDNLSVIVIYIFIQPPISVWVNILIQSFGIILLKFTVFSEFCFFSMYFFQVFKMCICVFACVYICELCTCLVCMKAQRAHWVPLNCSYRQFWATLWVLETKFRSYSRTACTFIH